MTQEIDQVSRAAVGAIISSELCGCEVPELSGENMGPSDDTEGGSHRITPSGWGECTYRILVLAHNTRQMHVNCVIKLRRFATYLGVRSRLYKG